MGKKDKKKKGLGAEKTAAKMAKKEAKRKKKEQGADDGGDDDDVDDVDGILKSLELKSDSVDKPTLEPCAHPSPRYHGTITAHCDQDKLLFFGGESFDGKLHETFGDLFVYHIPKAEWTALKTPSGPLPRSSHQAAIIPRMGGQLYIFGGEFTSSKGEHRHHNDLWVLHLQELRWERLKLPKGPGARSGHRMIAHKNKLYVFGGFRDAGNDLLQYLDQLYVLDLDSMAWVEVKRASTGAPWPPARAGHQFILPAQGSKAVLLGGVYSEGAGDNSKTVTHQDMWGLDLDTLTWQSLKAKGTAPSPRSGASSATYKDRALVVGGFTDLETDHDEEVAKCYDDVFALNLNNQRWSQMDFKENCPSPRRHAQLCIKGHLLYLFGGVYDTPKFKECTFNDFHVLDLKKDTWKCLVACDVSKQAWYGSDDEEDEGDDSDAGENKDFDDFSGEDAEEGDECEDDTLVDPLMPAKKEVVRDFFNRTQDHWLILAKAQANLDDTPRPVDTDEEKKAEKKRVKEIAKEVRKLAFKIASAHFRDNAAA